MGDGQLMISEPTRLHVYARSGVRSGSTPDETFRGVLRGHTVEHESATVIVTRQGLGAAVRTWLTFDGAIKTAVVLTGAETVALGELLGKATDQGDLMAASDEPWFTVRPGARRRGKVIHLPLMYIGRESLTGVEISVRDQKHVVGLGTEGGSDYN